MNLTGSGDVSWRSEQIVILIRIICTGIPESQSINSHGRKKKKKTDPELTEWEITISVSLASVWKDISAVYYICLSRHP